MAITIYEQLQLLDNTVGPEKATLLQLVELSSQNMAINFITTYELFDAETNSEASRYLTKVLRTCVLLSQSQTRNQVTTSLLNIVVSLVSQSNFTFTQINSAADSAWSDFVNSKILESIEIFSGVRREEKTAYVALNK